MLNYSKLTVGEIVSVTGGSGWDTAFTVTKMCKTKVVLTMVGRPEITTEIQFGYEKRIGKVQ